MIVKAQDLHGRALDWAVLRCEHPCCSAEDAVIFVTTFDDYDGTICNFSTDWAQAGPIIQRERINVTYSDDHKRWEACYTVDGNPIHRFDGATPLVAAMRAFVGFTLGGAVDVPEELTC